MHIIKMYNAPGWRGQALWTEKWLNDLMPHAKISEGIRDALRVGK